ncbi:unnamed protein product [Rangifer tarandus platyrhynchus]|uniref:Uncharacterized protein n=2 Tax=Rangifer tarandus platyrhynchus TaxID=3082113 RepID=A0ABN8Z4R5_RANTA|nr:unnamed protein product [Rangifer tarandus platyrhynchus]
MSVYFPLSVFLGFPKCFLKEEDQKIQLCKRSVQTISRPSGPGRGDGGLSISSAILVFLTPPSFLGLFCLVSKPEEQKSNQPGRSRDPVSRGAADPAAAGASPGSRAVRHGGPALGAARAPGGRPPWPSPW